MLTYVIIIIIIALLFDFSNGLNDAANSIATVVATRVLSPRKAVLWAAFFNFIAAFGFPTKVAETIQNDLIQPGIINPDLILAALLSAIVWTIGCTHRGLPISVSHALIGSLAGAAIARNGLFNTVMWGKLGVIAAFIVLSPIIGMALGSGLMILTAWLARKSRPRSVDRVFRVLQLISAAIYSLSHGLNDAQKTMGIISALLFSVGMNEYATRTTASGSTELAWWIILSCHAMIAVGTYIGGWKVIKTLGHKVTKLQPVGGFCAETSGGVTILILSWFGIPVSTTHTITGAIFGVGMTHRLSSVRWGVGTRIVTAWVLTLPASASLAAVLYWIVAYAHGA